MCKSSDCIYCKDNKDKIITIDKNKCLIILGRSIKQKDDKILIYQRKSNIERELIIEKDLKDFGFDNLKDDEHLEGLPLDRHGKINPDFHKEIFLGNHELFETDIQHDEEKRNKKLEEIFNE